MLTATHSFCEDNPQQSSVYEKPILFRGVEWGSPYAEVKKALPNGLELYMRDRDDIWYPIEELMFHRVNRLSKAILGCETVATSDSAAAVQIAGSELDDLRLYFVYKTNDEGLLVKDSDHTSLIFAEYTLRPKGIDVAYSDLISKLTSLYVTSTEN